MSEFSVSCKHCSFAICQEGRPYLIPRQVPSYADTMLDNSIIFAASRFELLVLVEKALENRPDTLEIT